jgi:hypothetical protein
LYLEPLALQVLIFKGATQPSPPMMKTTVAMVGDARFFVKK